MSGLSIASWVALLVDAVLIAILFTQWRNYSRRVRLTLLAATMLVMPVAVALPAAQADFSGMKTQTFCGRCHEMGPYAQSLHSEDEESVPAIHYQNNWVPQTTACYSCHTDYTVFGGVLAKWNGLRHMYVHYVTGPPPKIKLYGTYNTQNCLYCHGPAKNYLESKTHTRKTSIAELQSGKKSCLECHDVTHVLETAARASVE